MIQKTDTGSGSWPVHCEEIQAQKTEEYVDRPNVPKPKPQFVSPDEMFKIYSISKKTRLMVGASL